MKDAYGNDMTADLAEAKKCRKRLSEILRMNTLTPELNEERISLIFKIRILEDDGR